MKIAVMGSGGIGGYFGGLLAGCGHSVVFIARGEHLRAIRTRGLRVERAAGEPLVVAPADATDDPAEVGTVDLVLQCVKTYDLVPSIELMRPLVGPQTAILTTQNGIEAPDLLAEAFGVDAVLPGVVYSELAIKEPGVIFQGQATPRLVFGERDGRESERALDLAAALAAAGIEHTLSRNILGALWGKFCFICAMSGVTTLARKPMGPIMADDESRELLRATIAEVRDVGVARGIRFDADPVDAGMVAAARFNPEAKSSMLRDLERGRRLEVEALNGAAVRLGRSLGVPMPVNQAIYAALRLAQPDVGARDP